MAKVISTPLSSALFPTDWIDELSTQSMSLSSDIFAFDCYGADFGTELICRLEEKHSAALERLSFSIDGTPFSYQATGIPRGCRLRFDRAQGKSLTVSEGGKSFELSIHPDQAEDFKNQNVILSITVEPDPKVLVDWMNFNAAHHNAQSALIFVRFGRDYSFEKLHAALLEQASGIELEHVHLCACNVPLGHPKMPAETSRHLAPDAPGKAMLPEPVADPWRSPIFELGILEVARRRFLRDARAVLFCQPFDLVTSKSGSVFDIAASEGFVKFQGLRAYPFALEDDAPRRHGDHNCRSFDGKRAENIWVASPAKMEPNAFWRQFRVSNMEAAQVTDLSYWRCMAIRHPDLKVSELVPKSSLVEDAELTALVKDEFGAKPKAPPKAKASAKKERKNDRVLVVTTMKNEGPFILEWLAYHRSIGVTDFLVYTNDCTDGTDTMFELLQSKGLVEHAENPFRESGLKPQHAALQASESTDLVKQADWLICMDVDEYINIHVGDGTLDALFRAVPEATLISMTWRLFGNADIAAFEDRPIIEQFDQCAPALCRKPHQAWGFKTLFRNLGHYKKFGVHRPKGLRPEYLDDIDWVNGSGQKMPLKMLRSGWRSSTSTIGYDLVSLNHYALRSAESFLVKRDRGRVNHVDRDQGLAYWFRMNHNAQQELSIKARLPRMREELARLMADPEIAAAHAACVASHQTRIAELMDAAEYRALYDEITGERLRALSRMLHHFGNQVFLDGPDAVPLDYHLAQAE